MAIEEPLIPIFMQFGMTGFVTAYANPSGAITYGAPKMKVGSDAALRNAIANANKWTNLPRPVYRIRIRMKK